MLTERKMFMAPEGTTDGAPVTNAGNGSDNGAAPPEKMASGAEGQSEMTERVSKLEAQVQSDIRQLRNLKTSLQKDLESQIAARIAPLMEKFTEIATPKESEEHPKGKDAEKVNPEVTKLRAETEALKKQIAESERRRLEAEQTRMQQEEKSALAQQLTKAGVDPDALGLAMASLYTEQRRLQRNEQGEICFKVKGQFDDQLLSLSEGVEQWLRTNEGKRCLPPRGVSGSGTVAGNAAQKPRGGKMTKAEADAVLMEGLFGIKSEA